MEGVHALSPEIISNQPTINIGMIGHVSHGKTTVVKAITGTNTIKYKSEKEKNITIKLGYANAKIFVCDSDQHHMNRYLSRPSNSPDEFPCPDPGCSGTMTLVRHVSFVDCPGHNVLMSTMLNGVSIMDAALILVAANTACPQPQTQEHLAAVEIMGLDNLIVLQNKIDLVSEHKALENYHEIQQFVGETVGQHAPVIPISAQFGYNIDLICETIVKKVNIPEIDIGAAAKMIVLRSFDINRPHTGVEELKGGVIGGSIVRGLLSIGDEIEIRPGLLAKNTITGEVTHTPLKTRIVSLRSDENNLAHAISGGLIAIGTTLDPTLTKGDRLVGHILGKVGQLPEVYTNFVAEYKLLRFVLGSQNERVAKLSIGEILMINIGAFSVQGQVTAVSRSDIAVRLAMPACFEMQTSFTMSRRLASRWRLIGKGQITSI